MTISTSASQAVEELAYQYLPYRAEEDLPSPNLADFHAHVLNNINNFREDGTEHSSFQIHAASDAHSFGYYLDMEEGLGEISAQWEQIKTEAQRIFEEDK